MWTRKGEQARKRLKNSSVGTSITFNTTENTVTSKTLTMNMKRSSYFGKPRH